MSEEILELDEELEDIEEGFMSESLILENKSAMEFYKSQLEKHKSNNHPAAKHIAKILKNPTNKTNVLRNAIHGHCYECSHDSADPAGSHPKKCTSTSCPLYSERPGAKKEKETKEVDPKLKATRQANAAKARTGKKMTVKEALELIK